MKRFYKLVIGDSRDMSHVPDRSVDLIVTSPPYWQMKIFSDKESDMLQGDLSRIPNKRIFFRELTKTWKECNRTLKLGSMLVCNWQDLFNAGYDYPRELCITGDMVKSIEDAGFYLISEWIWQRSQGAIAMTKAKCLMYGQLENMTPRAAANWAYCFVFQKYGGRKFKLKRKLDFTVDEWKEWISGIWYIEAARISDFVRELSGGAVFPTELPRRFIKIYTEPNQVILDPFLGTGTTMLAAFKTQRSCIGYEVLQNLGEVIRRKVGWGQKDISGDEIDWQHIDTSGVNTEWEKPTEK